MRAFDRTQLGDGALIQGLKARVKNERGATAEVLADLAEVLERRLYVPAGYPSMSSYCVGELGFSEDETWKRIQAAEAARKCPEILEALAAGRLHLTAIVLLAPHLAKANAAEFLRVASGKTKLQIQMMLAEKFPQDDVPELVRPVSPVQKPRATSQAPELVPEPVAKPTPVATSASAPHPAPTPRHRITPLAPQRFALQVTIDGRTQQKLQRAKELLSHKLPSGNLAAVLALALDALIERLEKSKCGATDRPRRPRQIKGKRTVPAHVRREVWACDQGRCTFVSEAGKRCESRKLLEFDHIEPVARGGLATPSNLRLRCRAHNQFEAERALGAGFMHSKRFQPQFSSPV